MASSTDFLVLLVFILSLFSVSYALQDETVHSVAEILADSGFISMSLTLQIVLKPLLSNATTATIFSATDDSFSRYGQPSFSVLEHHISPVAYSFDDLQSMAFGSTIPTLSSNRSLMVTTLPSDNQISINGVKIVGSPIYDDGILIVYAVDDFFDLDFETLSPALSPSSESAPLSPAPSPNSKCQIPLSDPLPDLSLRQQKRRESLSSNGLSIMSAFLDLQLAQFDNGDTQFTVFAPIDDSLQVRIGDFNGWGTLFLRHVVPCEVSLSDLSDLEGGAALSTLSEGFLINLISADGLVLVNGVPIVSPDVYHDDRLTVHGIQQVLAMPESNSEAEVANSPSGDGEEVVMSQF